MTDSPPGWHPDPRGRHEHRYWDGSQWTDHVADQGTMSTDPVAEVEKAVEAPIGPSMVNLPAISPAEIGGSAAPAQPEPEPAASQAEPAATQAEPAATQAEPAATQPEPAATPAEPAATQPEPQAAPGGPLWSDGAPPAAEGAAVAATPEPAASATPEPVGGRSPDLAALLSVVAPGSGHLYLGAQGQQRNVAFVLLAATVGAIVLSWFGFVLFLLGLAVWIAAAAYALYDLRAGLSNLREARLPARVLGWILVAGGGALIVSLLLPWYRASGGGASLTIGGFEILSIIDIILLVVGVASLVSGLAALGMGPISSSELPQAMPLMVAAGAAVALGLVAFRLLLSPGGDPGEGVTIGRAPGILLAAAASIAILVAAASAISRPKT